jgi:hypothetical protein
MQASSRAALLLMAARWRVDCCVVYRAVCRGVGRLLSAIAVLIWNALLLNRSPPDMSENVLAIRGKMAF